jgi:hypothetical protein
MKACVAGAIGLTSIAAAFAATPSPPPQTLSEDTRTASTEELNSLGTTVMMLYVEVGCGLLEQHDAVALTNSELQKLPKGASMQHLNIIASAKLQGLAKAPGKCAYLKQNPEALAMVKRIQDAARALSQPEARSSPAPGPGTTYSKVPYPACYMFEGTKEYENCDAALSKGGTEAEAYIKAHDPDGAEAVETLRLSQGPSISRVYKLCWIEDPSCVSILRASYERVMALPHGLNHPMMGICDQGAYGLGVKGPNGQTIATARLSDEEIVATFMQMAGEGGAYPSLDYFEAEVLRVAMPCWRNP